MNPQTPPPQQATPPPTSAGPTGAPHDNPVKHSGNPMMQLEEFLELYLVKKAPFQLPVGLKEFLVKIMPWVNLVFILILLPVLLLALGVGTLGLGIFAIAGRPLAGFWYFVQIGLSAIMVVLELMALPGLFKRKRKAWNLVYYIAIFNAVLMLVEFNISGLILGTVVSLYFLFQIKEYYKA